MAKSRYRPKVPEGYSYCYRCHGIMPLKDFHKNRAKSRGVQSECKLCRKSLKRG